MSLRPVRRLIEAKPTLEGAGVRLRRAFGFGNTSEFDPFLLLDDFRNDVPEDYLAGFPWHPHRGIETITYVLAGTVEHGDSLGNRGTIGAGDIQWMTAGRGIIHQEMPKGDQVGQMHGFQLWANLPASLKMTAPRYQEIKAPEIPELTDDDGTRVRLVCGSFWGKRGPVEGIAADPVYIDVSVPPGKRKTLPVETTRHAFAYVFAGSGKFCNASGPLAVPTEGVKWLETAPPTEAGNRSLVLFDSGENVAVQAGEEGIRFLLVSGKPLQEPVAWYGPIVMNTQAQLQQAFEELREGTFLKPASFLVVGRPPAPFVPPWPTEIVGMRSSSVFPLTRLRTAFQLAAISRSSLRVQSQSTASPWLGSICIAAVLAGMRILNAEQIKILLPVRPFFLQGSGAKAHFDPGADAVFCDAGLVHILKVFVTRHGAPAQGAGLNRCQEGLLLSGLHFRFHQIPHNPSTT